jgi:hypothetical protein
VPSSPSHSPLPLPTCSLPFHTAIFKCLHSYLW